jgi:hypothetical protein
MKRAVTKNILKVDKILELLKQLEVPTKEAEPLRIDMVIEAKGKTISTVSFNETSYHTLLHGKIFLQVTVIKISSFRLIVIRSNSFR